MSQTKKFKAESQQLLNLMINSIYANPEIFLRELISNASDAIDKYHYLSLTNEQLAKGEQYEIVLTLDSKNRKFIISDNGIGMTEEEVNDNLGTIARSGSKDFINLVNDDNQSFAKEIDIIGQFGVGFYSAFMVAKEVMVETKSPFSDSGYRFTSTGESTYQIEPIEKTDRGTTITLTLRDDTEEADYSKFLDEYTIKRLVKKYSDYVRYPIKMLVTVFEDHDDGCDCEHDCNHEHDCDCEHECEHEHDHNSEPKPVQKLETLNSMVPLWKRQRKDITDEELNEFYKQKYNDYTNPLVSLFVSVEGNITYDALLFIPKNPPYDLYSDKYEKGLQLYTKGVFIMEKCKELIPDYLRFVKGLVDSSDLSLNISREILQQNKQLEKIATNVEKKVISKLEKIKKDEFDNYKEFFKNYGRHLKFGVYNDYGLKKDLLQNLLIYQSVNQEDMISFEDYTSKMLPEQKYIYYASGKNKNAILAMPQMDLLKKKGYDVLVLTDDVDEFAIRILNKYQDYEFKSITQGDLDILDEEAEKEVEKVSTEKKDLIDAIKEVLKDQVSDVKISQRLSDSPFCLVSGDGLSLEMEKVLQGLPNDQNVKAQRILEINPHHQLFDAIDKVYQQDQELFVTYVNLLYAQTLLLEGIKLDDPGSFSDQLCKLMIKKA